MKNELIELSMFTVVFNNSNSVSLSRHLAERRIHLKRKLNRTRIGFQHEIA
jgi:hypothetical protein